MPRRPYRSPWLRPVRLIHTTLHKALKQAVRWGLIVRNVAEVVQAPRWARKELRVLSPEEVGRLLKASRGERLACLYLLAVTTGLREGELLGLRWRDVNLEAEVLSVSQQLTRTRAGLSFTSPKRGKTRSVRLTPTAVAALKVHRATQNEERLKADSLWQDLGIAIVSPTGSELAETMKYSTLSALS